MNDVELLQAIYDTENHFEIRVEWDAGFEVRLNTSVYSDPKDLKIHYCTTAREALEWLANETNAKVSK